MHLQKPLSNYSITLSARTSSDFGTADVARIIGTPGEISFTVTPTRTLMIAETMHRIGLLNQARSLDRLFPCWETWQEGIVDGQSKDAGIVHPTSMRNFDI